MDFNDSPEEAAFRDHARDWLKENAPKRDTARARRSADEIVEAKSWQAKKAQAGYACIPWPKATGGGGGTPMQKVIFDQEEAAYGLNFGIFEIGLGMCVPTVLAFGDDATKARFAGPAVRGDEVWCQLFSEPAAGSDVAASRTKAVLADDGSGDWIIDGQKVWTSGAHYSDFGILLVRTDPDVPKHKGLTMFWIDMHDPAVEVRPIHQASGGSEFNEVFFTGLRVKDSQRLGEVGKGWNVALVTLMNERLAVGGATGINWPELMAMAREIPGANGEGTALKDAGFREKLADWYVMAEGLKMTRARSMTALSRGQTPGPEASVGKVVSALQLQDMASEAMDRLDQFGIIDDPALAPLAGAFQQGYFWAAGLRIAGGTDEILKNIIAERVLGLPGDIRVDRDVAFKDQPRGA